MCLVIVIKSSTQSTFPSYVPHKFGSRNYDVICSQVIGWGEKWWASWVILHLFPLLTLAEQEVEQKIHNRH